MNINTWYVYEVEPCAKPVLILKTRSRRRALVTMRDMQQDHPENEYFMTDERDRFVAEAA